MAGLLPVHVQAPLAAPKNEVKGDDVARRQLSQWQCACQSGAAVALKVTSPQKQRPVIGWNMVASFLFTIPLAKRNTTNVWSVLDRSLYGSDRKQSGRGSSDE